MKSGPARAVAFLCGVYVIAGIVSGALASQAASHQAVIAWRWAAWLVSAVAFGAHIVYEQVRLRTSPKITALHVSSAAGLAGFGLAIAANVHARVVPPHQPSLMLALSLAIWPVMIALPAFVVALVTAILLARVRRSR
jgi:hypothetical protein